MKKLFVFATCLALACIPRRNTEPPSVTPPVHSFMQMQPLELEDESVVERFTQERRYSTP